MVSRRSFIKSSMVAGLAPGLLHAQTADRHDDATVLVVDGDCADTRHFTRQCRLHRLEINDSIELVETLAQGGQARLFGLTRDSSYFIVASMSALHGYRLTYHGVHDFRDGQCRHQLRGEPDAMNALVANLPPAGALWTCALAEALPRLGNTQKAALIDTQCQAASATARRGHLVSSCVERV